MNLETGIINVTAEVSKVREPRKITIQPNLAAWLRAYPLSKFPIVLGNFKKRRQKFAKQFGHALSSSPFFQGRQRCSSPVES